MVVKMIKWRPWPPLPSKKFQAKITVHHLKALNLQPSPRFSVEIKWRGSKGRVLGALRRKKTVTKEEILGDDGLVLWDEDFTSICTFSSDKEGSFHPWDLSFTVFNGLKNASAVAATASLNLSEFASAAEKHESAIDVPLLISGSNAVLHLSVILVELSNEEPPEAMARPPVLLFPRSPCYGEILSPENDEISMRRVSPKRVNIFKGLYSLRTKRTAEEEGSDGRSSDRSEDTEFNDPLDTDSLDGSDEGSSEEVKDTSIRKSFSYGALAYVNTAGASVYSNTSGSEDEDFIYYSHPKSDEVLSDPDHTTQRSSKRGLLPWRKRKLGKAKGEPLLKKYYGEEGGDDIDFDRRQFGSSDEGAMGESSVENQLYVSEFGDDHFAVGMWENKDIKSRDGRMQLKTQVFFASIDQRSERAAGESACTALVAVIAHWLQSNCDGMPIKSQLDALIREGSSEWRSLCENEVYGERFPDKHFDLETVLEANVRPLSVVPEKSFIGFFHPEGIEDKGFDFLQGVMSFDNIWDEICRSASDMSPTSDPSIYIVSWNDHFFVLKVENDAYYIIDTLGERLHEGCNQAFILKFDKDTSICRTAKETDTSQKDGSSTGKETTAACSNEAPPAQDDVGTMTICTGKESCKEYIKSFLAAIPIRELQDDLKKGLMAASTRLHQRLQIEFHYTRAAEANQHTNQLCIN